MNGRIYDPLLGRFLSADTTVQFPGNLQSFNRYSYVNNNPLSYVDPTGFLLGSPELQQFAQSINETARNLPPPAGLVVVAGGAVALSGTSIVVSIIGGVDAYEAHQVEKKHHRI